MFEINLLPKELRKKKLVLLQADIIRLCVGLVGLCIILHIVLSLAVWAKRHSFNGLTSAYNKLLPEKNRIDSIKSEFKNLNEKIKLAEQVSSDTLVWAQILNKLSDIVPSNLWLTRLSYQPEKSSIIIRGMVLEKDSDSMATIGQFINGWKDGRIEVDAVNKKYIKQVEILEFNLTCYLK